MIKGLGSHLEGTLWKRKAAGRRIAERRFLQQTGEMLSQKPTFVRRRSWGSLHRRKLSDWKGIEQDVFWLFQARALSWNPVEWAYGAGFSQSGVFTKGRRPQAD